MRGSDGISLCGLPCFGPLTFVGFSWGSRCRAWGTGSVCVWRLAGPEETLHWKLSRWWRSKSLREDEDKWRRLAHTFQNKEVWPCILHYAFETRVFKEPTHIIKGSTSTCIKMRPIADLRYRICIRIMWWKLPKWFHEILLVGGSCKRTIFDPTLCVDNRNLRQTSPTRGTTPPFGGAKYGSASTNSRSSSFQGLWGQHRRLSTPLSVVRMQGTWFAEFGWSPVSVYILGLLHAYSWLPLFPKTKHDVRHHIMYRHTR